MTSDYQISHTIQQTAFAILRQAGLQPCSPLEPNRLYHCRTETDRNPKKAWYRIDYSMEEHAYLLKYGSFSLETRTERLPVNGEILADRAQCRRQEQARQDAEEKAAVRQRNAELTAAYLRRVAKQTTATAQHLLEAGSSDLLPEYLEKKRLPLIAPAKAIRGRDLLRLLPPSQRLAHKAVLLVPNHAERLFLLIPIYQHDGRLSNVQIVLPEKVEMYSNGKRGDKVFLAGKNTLKGAYLALTPLSEVPNGSTLHLFEAYAKAIPAYLIGKPALVAFSVSNISNVLNNIVPSDYPTADAWKRREKAHTYPRQYAIVNCADNDSAALTTAKKVKWRVKSVFPVFPGVKDWDDLYRQAGLEEVERQLATPRDLNAIYHSLKPEQYIANLKLAYPDGLSWLISDTGNGKTQEVCRYANEHPEEMVILIAPTNGICFQTAQSLKKAGKPFQLVMGNMKVKLPFPYAKEYAYDCAGLTVTTLASFVKKFDFSQCLYPVTLFVDEAHGLSEDFFRQADIMQLYAMLPNAGKVVLMTATPHFHHANGLQAAPRIIVQKVEKPKTRCKLLYYPKQEYSVIRHFAEQGRVVVEMNSLSGMTATAKALRKQGFSGVYTLCADDKFTPDSVFWHIMLHESLPADCRILLTTKLYETGLNIRDTDIKTVLTFPVKPLNIRRAPEHLLTPHTVKQVANRTRAAAPDVYYCLPACAQNNNTSAFNGEYHYKRFTRRAENQRAEYLDMIKDDSVNAALAAFNGEMRENTPRLITWTDNAPNISAAGIDLSVCEQYQAALLYSGVFLRAELDKHGLRFDGEIHLDELTAAAECSDAERDAIKTATAETQEEADAAFMEDVVRLSKLSDKELQRDDSRHASKMMYFRQMATPDAAAALLLKIGKEGKAFSQVKKRLTVLKAMINAAKQKQRIATATAIMAFLKKDSFTGKEIVEFMTDTFAADRVLRHELDSDWRTGTTRCMTAKRALSHLRSFKDIDARHTEFGTVFYQKVDDAPIVSLWKTALGKTPFSDVFFKKWFFEKTSFSEAKTLECVVEAADTLQNERTYSAEKTNVSGLVNNLHAYLASELTDYAAEQIRIHGNVF